MSGRRSTGAPAARDFTLAAYNELLTAMRCLGLDCFGVRQWLRGPRPTGVIVRHDVDRRPRNALAMARLEADRGVCSTYYFRIVGSSFNPQMIREVAGLGHEVGYHYEDLSLAGGDLGRALERFGSNLETLRAIAPIHTIAMHGSPMSRWNNLDLWRSRSFTDFGIEAEAFLTLDYSDFVYLTDTGRSWASDSVNLRDRPHGPSLVAPQVEDTNSLIRYLRSGSARRIAMCVHPERWDARLSGWVVQMLRDRAANTAKLLISRLRALQDAA